MKCHYIRYKGERVLIPGCMCVAVSQDISDCCCPKNEKSIEERVEELEKAVKQLKKTHEKPV